MADTSETTDINAHESTYTSFTTLMTRGTIVCAALAAFVVFMIA